MWRCSSRTATAPYLWSKQVAILYATIHGYLKDTAVADIGAYEQGLYRYLDDNAAANDVMETIQFHRRPEARYRGSTEEQVPAAYTEQFTKEK